LAIIGGARFAFTASYRRNAVPAFRSLPRTFVNLHRRLDGQASALPQGSGVRWAASQQGDPSAAQRGNGRTVHDSLAKDRRCVGSVYHFRKNGSWPVSESSGRLSPFSSCRMIRPVWSELSVGVPKMSFLVRNGGRKTRTLPQLSNERPWAVAIVRFRQCSPASITSVAWW